MLSLVTSSSLSLNFEEIYLDSKTLDAKSDIFKKIIALDHLYFPNPWTQESWENILIKNHYKLFILHFDEEVIATSLFMTSKAEELSHLLKICVDKKYQKQGYGSTILKQSLEVLLNDGHNNCFLEVETSNLSALALYKEHKFEKVGIAKNFYGKNRDAFRMLRVAVQH